MDNQSLKPETTQRFEHLRRSYERGTISQDVLRMELISALMTYEGMPYTDADTTAFDTWVVWTEEANEQ